MTTPAPMTGEDARAAGRVCALQALAGIADLARERGAITRAECAAVLAVVRRQLAAERIAFAARHDTPEAA